MYRASFCAAAILFLSFPVVKVTAFDKVFIQFGANLGTRIPQRIQSLLAKVPNVQVLPLFNVEGSFHEPLDSSSLVLSLGNTTIAGRYLRLDEIGFEGFQLVSKPYLNGSKLLVSDGKPFEDGDIKYALNLDFVHYGAAVGAFAALEQLGFAFLHPIQPLIPSKLSIGKEGRGGLSIKESPYWAKRTWHIHTQHPLEFTEVLNGYDIPMMASGKDSAASPTSANDKSVHVESWESMFAELDGLFVWLLANRQNRVELLLLGNRKWDAYADLTSGPMRQERLTRINALAHDYGILIGADVPLANLQQHGWAMVDVKDDIATQRRDIEERVDWVLGVGYDFISTESGLSEFTKPSCDLMLDLFSTFTERARGYWSREALTKVHCSTDQFCEEKDPVTGGWKYPDPRNTDEPINFNFLPTYEASGRLAVMPHTIQVYSFDDPTAGAYGNANFSYMSDYMTYEASRKVRDVLYYGETAYWVNVDVDVPLFLPISGQRRLYDLRRTAALERQGGFKISGQMNFESGWEYGYHISNVVAARAVWNPMLEIESEELAFSALIGPILERAFGGSTGSKLTAALLALIKTQSDVFIYGLVDGQPPEGGLSKLSGHAYMSGSDTWVDLPRMLGISLTQPDKVHHNEPDDPLWPQALSLVKELERRLLMHNTEFQRIRTEALKASGEGEILSVGSVAYLNEIVGAVNLLYLRAKHNRILYTAQDRGTSASGRKTLLFEGRMLLENDARAVADSLSSAYRVPKGRISGWRQGPTVYPYGYVYAADSLYFWWRDQGQAEARSEMASISPCYLNRIEPIELIIGWGKALEQAIRIALKAKGMIADNSTVAGLIADCFAPPLREITFPRDL